MTLVQLRNKFDSILNGLNGNTTINFCTAVENAYEAYVLVTAIKEYGRIYGGIAFMHFPSSAFLNQKPGRFQRARAFKVKFHSGPTLFFAADVEIHGLAAKDTHQPIGIKFEADVVVIQEQHVTEVETTFRGYPAPQHLMGVYECKFGSYNKGQLRELLGLRRHVSFLSNNLIPNMHHQPNALHQRAVLNARPMIHVTMARPKNHSFFDLQTQLLFDLHQIVVN